MDDSERALLATVAELYFKQKLSQDEIAARLFFSRSKVSRLLQRAQDSGIVEIRIHFPYLRMPELEERIGKRYGLKECAVLRTEFKNVGEESSFERLTRFAASFIESALRPQMLVGISSGQTLNSISRHMQGRPELGLKFVQVKGMASEDGHYDFDSPTALQLLAEKFQSSFSQLYAPMFVRNEIARRYLLNEPLIANVLNLARGADLVIGSVASLEAEHNIWEGFLDPGQIAALRAKGAVGSMMGHFFDRFGKIVDPLLDEEAVGLRVDDLRKLKQFMVVAEGEAKASALSGALRWGCVSTLLVDETLAKALLACR